MACREWPPISAAYSYSCSTTRVSFATCRRTMPICWQHSGPLWIPSHLMARCQKVRRSPSGNDSAYGGLHVYGLV